MHDQLTLALTPTTSRMTITRAASGDERLIATVLLDDRGWRQLTGSEQWRQPYPTEWVGGAIARGELWLARKLGQPVGVIRVVDADPLFWGARDGGSALYVHTLAVRRGREDQGRAMLKWAAAARTRGRRRLRLDAAAANDALAAYYAGAGFAQGPRGRDETL